MNEREKSFHWGVRFARHGNLTYGELAEVHAKTEGPIKVGNPGGDPITLRELAAQRPAILQRLMQMLPRDERFMVEAKEAMECVNR